MNHTAIYALLLFLIFKPFLNAQTFIEGKVIDSQSKKKIPKVCVYIIQDKDKWISLGETNKNGEFRINIDSSEMDKNSEYEFKIDEAKYIPTLQKFDLFSNQKYVIEISENSLYKPVNEKFIYGGNCSLTCFGYYEPRDIYTVSELPKMVQEKLDTILQSRLGSNFYKKIYLNFGQIVDVNRVKIMNPNLMWEPSSYYLCFAFNDPKKGIGSYSADVELDSLGNQTNSLAFPNIKDFPEKGDIISKNELIKIAKKESLFVPKSFVELDYNEKIGSFVWLIESRKRVKKQEEIVNLEVEAHNGKVIEKNITKRAITVIKRRKRFPKNYKLLEKLILKEPLGDPKSKSRNQDSDL